MIQPRTYKVEIYTEKTPSDSISIGEKLLCPILLVPQEEKEFVFNIISKNWYREEGDLTKYCEVGETLVVRVTKE